MTPIDACQILGVVPGASPEQLRQAYYRLARVNHPDVSQAPDAGDRMKRINEAYEVLSNPNVIPAKAGIQRGATVTSVMWELIRTVCMDPAFARMMEQVMARTPENAEPGSATRPGKRPWEGL